jgi:ATP-dependent RNA helicase DeaD
LNWTNEEDVALDSEQVEALSFDAFHFPDGLMKGIRAADYKQPTPIQAESIPLAQMGRDMIAQARTGSGKSAAFLLPALARASKSKTLVLTPTRELAQQVANEAAKLGHFLNVKTVSVVGGMPHARQIDAIRRGADIVVATPGRLIDHLTAGMIPNFKPELLVLDEADEMLDMGFIEDIERIIEFLPERKQTLLFSATMPAAIQKLSKKVLTDPAHIKLNDTSTPHHDIQQHLYVVRENERGDAIVRLFDTEQPQKSIVFCRTKRDADEVCEHLSAKGFKARSIHSDLNQKARQDAIFALKKGHIQVLTATDVASRGLDVSDLSHVFNYSLPDQKERYVHRIGRTGRAGNKGCAITLATPGEILRHDFFKLTSLESFDIRKVPSRTDLEKLHRETLMAVITATPISESSKAACQDLLDGADAEEIICRLYSHIESLQKLRGPDRIGLGKDEVLTLEKQSKSRNSGGRGGFGGGRGRRGGGSGSSSGGRFGRSSSHRSGGRSEGRFEGRSAGRSEGFSRGGERGDSRSGGGRSSSSRRGFSGKGSSPAAGGFSGRKKSGAGSWRKRSGS